MHRSTYKRNYRFLSGGTFNKSPLFFADRQKFWLLESVSDLFRLVPWTENVYIRNTIVPLEENISKCLGKKYRKNGTVMGIKIGAADSFANLWDFLNYKI